MTRFKSIVFLLPAAIMVSLSVCNIPKVSLALMIMMNDNDYKRGNYHFSGGPVNEFSMWSVKGYDDVLDTFGQYRKSHPNDSVLYRNFKPDYRKFWRWYAYATDAYYKLPYRYLTPQETLINIKRPKY